MADYLDLSEGLGAVGWFPDTYKLLKYRDYLDFRAMFGATAVTVLRLESNRDAHLYGELILHDGGVRSLDTFGITCVQSSQDIASFRSGGSEGDEKLRIERDGTVASAAETGLKLRSRVLAAPAADPGVTVTVNSTMDPAQPYLRLVEGSSTMLTLSGTVGTSVGSMRAWYANGFTLSSRATNYQRLTLEGSDVAVSVVPGGGSSPERWGLFDTDSSGNRRLTIDDGTTAKELEVRAEKLRFRDTGASAIWGELYVSTDSYIASANAIYVDANNAGTLKDVKVRCNSLKILDSGGTTRCLVDNTGTLKLATASSTAARLVLDASASGKQWAIESTVSGGGANRLRFINETDAGTPTVAIDAVGSIYTPKYLVFTTAVTGQPGNSEGDQGSVTYQVSGNQRLWVKIGTGGANSWWFADLTQGTTQP